MYRFSEAVARYGIKEYPLYGFPEAFDEDRVRVRLREHFPGDRRVEQARVSCLGPYPEFNVPKTIVVRFPDSAVEVRYVEQ